MKLHKHPKLQEAFDRFAQQQNALLPDEEALNAITFSDYFKQRIQKLFKRQRQGYFVLFGTVGRRVASTVIAVLIAATVTTVSVEALREPVFRFITEVFEKFTQVFFVDDTPRTPQMELEKRLPTYIPEGYTLEREEYFSAAYRVYYTNQSTGDTLRYNQRILRSGEMLVDTEDTRYTPVAVGDYQGVTYENKGIITMIYSDDKYTYTISGAFPIEELIETAKSIEKR